MRHGRILRLHRRDQPGARLIGRHPWYRTGPGIVCALVLLVAACGGRAGPAGANAENGVGVHGYDVVAYHVWNRAERGDPAFTATHRGVVYHFLSAAHRDRFRADPERWLPAYGGWCAWAIADGELVDVDPERFLVDDGRLFLFYDGLWGDTLVRWRAGDPALLERRADAHWRSLAGALDRD